VAVSGNLEGFLANLALFAAGRGIEGESRAIAADSPFVFLEVTSL
jgi:hypothetical protein